MNEYGNHFRCRPCMVHVNVIDRGLFEVTYGSGAVQYFDQETFSECFEEVKPADLELSEAPIG